MSGGALAPDVLALLHALRVPVVIGYEFAEAGLVAVTLPGSPLQPARVLTSAGSSAALEVRVRDNEIQVRGGCPVSGQVDGTDAARHTDDGWLRSGDAGRLSGDGELIFLDRLGSLLDDAGQPVPSDPLESRLRRCAHVADAVIVRADGCLHALVTIDGPAVRNWAEERGIAVTSFKQLSQHPHVLNLIADEIGNAELPAGFCIERFASLPKGFDADDGELTRTGVVRRPIVLERYAAVVDALRRSDAMVGVSVELRLTDGRLLSIEEDVVINQVRRSAPDRRGVA
jgi:long-chain acyl-CoA synthetase